MEDHGVCLVLGDAVEAFQEKENGIQVALKSGLQLTANLVILAIGVAPDTAFIKGSGIKLGDHGHIIVNEHMQTNCDGVYAVGDAVQTTDLLDLKAAVPLAGPANKQGRIAADHIRGLNSAYKGTQGTAIIKIFGLTGASTGYNERQLQKLNIPYHTIYVHPTSHATYYPGAKQLSLKLLFTSEGKILGAQALSFPMRRHSRQQRIR